MQKSLLGFLRSNNSLLSSFEDIPHSIGWYLLFDQSGTIIYVGKAGDLHSRLRDHFSENEENDDIRKMAFGAIWFPQTNMADAENGEAMFYLAWIKMTGKPPPANKIDPPGVNRILLAKLLKQHPNYRALLRTGLKTQKKNGQGK